MCDCFSGFQIVLRGVELFLSVILDHEKVFVNIFIQVCKNVLCRLKKLLGSFYG